MLEMPAVRTVGRFTGFSDRAVVYSKMLPAPGCRFTPAALVRVSRGVCNVYNVSIVGRPLLSVDTSAPSDADRAGQPRAVWSTELEPIDVGGVRFLIYRDRERSVFRFLELGGRWSGRTYIVQGDERWTIADVRAAVESRAVALAAVGVGKGSPVMLLGWNSVDWVVGFWSVLRVGGVVVTANAWWSDEEILYAIERAKPALVLTDRPDRIPKPWPTLAFEELKKAFAAPTTPLPVPRADENAPALAMFTSGTTGLPKAAVFSHRSVVAGIHSQLALTRRLPQELADDHPVQVTLQTGPMFHIGGIQAILRAPVLGGTLVLSRGRFNPEEVLRLIEREGVHRWAGVIPTMALRVVDHPDVGNYDLSSVRSLTLGGTVVSEEIMARVRDVFSSAQRGVMTGWGLTETGGQLTVASGTETLEKPGSVGRALPFVELRIAEPDDEGVGEVLARSPMQMSGYLGEESPSIIDDDGWLRTGDVGRLDANGWLWLVGRSKDLIIRGGENIAAARVEQVLREHDTVADAAVMSLADSDLGEVVAAAVVVRAEAAVTPEELSTFAAARLSKFAVPTEWWIRTEALPMNEVGKVAKTVLSANWPTRARRKD